ncbi:hypothetical protein BU24DRAFT_245862 [Aaosphaeria arxii CBS 175.79]|uniref:Uncharacterized protein n=1 Tax=Aaosphaeria arxii CBS 175.79 TaxID=1450172 RepID=A0A6A5XKT7_9PLEO|nr:uncharacterized protein BU24DRAFT_245862 [Aaosphaeria arxii CBS 175.79]KAF2013752.1 hypothetical protein BU24DRAFT_245862 [Aaosphaeria arxii CBS 175.79]
MHCQPTRCRCHDHPSLAATLFISSRPRPFFLLFTSPRERAALYNILINSLTHFLSHSSQSFVTCFPTPVILLFEETRSCLLCLFVVLKLSSLFPALTNRSHSFKPSHLRKTKYTEYICSRSLITLPTIAQRP